jgi:hypothetical protein
MAGDRRAIRRAGQLVQSNLRLALLKKASVTRPSPLRNAEMYRKSISDAWGIESENQNLLKAVRLTGSGIKPRGMLKTCG